MAVDLTHAVRLASGPLLALAALAALLVAPGAWAFCRTTTCDLEAPKDHPPSPECATNTKVGSCSTKGQPLFWPSGCLWFGTETHGSEKLHISSAELHDAVKQAFDAWASVDCGGGRHPSFAVADTDELYGAAECGIPKYNGRAANASVWMFSDTQWNDDDPVNAIALTHVTADLATGEIYDADVELNSFGQEIAVSPVASAQPKLLTVVTHEVGHYLGLAHSDDSTAVMAPYYSSSHVDIGNDDRAGICAIYPPSGAPTCGEPEPLFGFSRYCTGANPSTTPETVVHPGSGGCSVTTASPFASRHGSVVALLALGVTTLRRRGRARAARHFGVPQSAHS